MKLAYTLRFRLLLIYFLTIIVPAIIVLFTMPVYYQGLISKEVETLTNSVMSALTKTIDTYLDDLERLTITPYYNEAFMDSLELINSDEYDNLDYYSKFITEHELINNLNYYIQITRRDILGAVIVTSNGKFFCVTKKQGFTTMPEGYNYKEENWYKQAVAADGTAVIINSHPQNYLSEGADNKVFSVARLIKEPNSKKRLAVLLADADTVVLENVLSDVDFDISSTVAIFDNESNLIYSNKVISESVIQQIKNGEKYVNDSDDTFTVVSRLVPKSNWKLAVILSNSSLNSKLRLVKMVSILFTSSLIIIALTLFTIFSSFITKPFKKMISVMQKVEMGDLSVRYLNEGKDEISQVGNALNNMIIKLEETIEKVYKSEINKKNAEFLALQAQINPHFLYNILNNFISLNRIGAKEKLEKSIISLTTLMRYTISNADYTTISKEFHFLEQYCELQKLRFSERLDYYLYYDNRIAEYRIPKLLLQPLVENAVIHGIEPLDRKGKVSVSAVIKEYSGQRFVEISVTDDGCGFDISLKTQKSIGIANVEERLKIAFPDSAMKIESEIGKGTEIIINILEKDMVV
ncbi:MAG TPA: sensor histidine kinase [Clostridiaceae bacterium]|nr:sensor histidine kinase [Clostridiaceae bacterium]